MKLFNIAATVAAAASGAAMWLSHSTSVSTDVVGFMAFVAAVAAAVAVDGYTTYWQGR